MGKTSKWLRSFLAGKKVKEKDKENCTTNKNSSFAADQNPSTPILMQPTTPKERRRWSFRRSSATAAAAHKDTNSVEAIGALMAPENHEQKKNAMAVAVASAAAAVAAAQVAADMIRITGNARGRSSAVEEAAAIKIQSVFRSYLAKKALCALKGLVKLQALVRGHLVRKQATATLRCMHALVTAQARARAQRIRMAEEGKPVNHRLSLHRKSTQDNLFQHPYNDIDRGIEENIKIVEMDIRESKGSSKSRHSYSNHPQTEQSHRAYSKQDTHKVSPAPSALTDMSPRACSGHFEDYSFTTAQSSPQYYSAMSKPDPSRVPFAISYDYTFFPNYMANTESWRAKVRSQSTPKQRPDTSERPPSRRRPSMEGRNMPRAVKMQRSSSHVGPTAQNYQYPWSVKLDRSAVSLKDSECGSSSTVLTNTYCRSLVAFDPHGNRY